MDLLLVIGISSIVNLSLSCINASIAKRDGRKALFWIFLSIMFGFLIPFIILELLPSGKSEDLE